MKISELIRSRLSRGWSFSALGPNEARIYYDLACSAGAWLVMLAFARLYRGPEPPASVLRAMALPAAFFLLNLAGGLYGRQRRATARRKSLGLLVSIAGSCGAGWMLGIPAADLALWAVVVGPPVVLARLLLELPHTRNRSLVNLAVNRRGPVLVLGGAGYIGSHTVDLLLRKGYSVRVLDRLMYGRGSIAEFEAHPAFELVEGDVTDIASLTAAMRNSSAVIHLAGLVGDPACAVDEDFTRHTNIVATRMAMDVAQSLGIYRFVFASSCSVYGISDAEVDESSTTNPVSLYAHTKVDSERELLESARDEFFVTILRFATVFGHSRRPRFDLVANLFTAQAMIEGRIRVIGRDQWRPFVHVRDLARAIVVVLDAEPTRIQSQIFNVGDRRLNVTIGQLAELVQGIVREVRPDVELVVEDQAPGDRRNYAVSFDKIRRHLGFETVTSLEEGIREMVRNFEERRYDDFHDEIYSNVATTRRAVETFYDPREAARLYAPRKVG